MLDRGEAQLVRICATLYLDILRLSRQRPIPAESFSGFLALQRSNDSIPRGKVSAELKMVAHACDE